MFPIIKNNISTTSFASRSSFYQNFTRHGVSHRDNPEEYEKDRCIGVQIEEARAQILLLKQALGQTDNPDETEQIKKELEKWREKRAYLVNNLTERHLKFAFRAADSYSYLPVQYDDLVSSASLGIYEAAKRFSPSKHPGIHFLDYAKFWVKQQINRDHRKVEEQISLPTQVKSIRKKIMEKLPELTETLGRNPSYEEIAQHFGLTVHRVKNIMLRGSVSTISLDESVNNDEDSSEYSNFIADPTSDSFIENQMFEEEIDFVRSILNDPSCLNEKEKFIIMQRYLQGNKDGKHLVILEDLATQMGLTRERVRQIEKEALLKLRNKLNSNYSPNNPTTEIVPPGYVKKTTKEKKQTPLENLIFLDKLVAKLTVNESPENAEKIRNKLKTYSAQDFTTIMKNVTNTKRGKVLVLRYFKKTATTKDKIAKRLGITPARVSAREKEAIEDLKRFLLTDEHMGCALLKKVLSENLNSFTFKIALLKRIQKVSQEELSIIINNVLTSKEKLFIDTKYGISQEAPLGWKIKTNSELAEMFNTQEDMVYIHLNKGMKKLKEYFSKAAGSNTNLANFAKVIAGKIEDENNRKIAQKTLQQFSQFELDNFFKMLLTAREIEILTIRYNLDKPLEPKKQNPSREQIAQTIKGMARSTAETIENNACDKIRAFFNGERLSRREVFLNKLLEDFNDSARKEELKTKLLEVSEKNFQDMLKFVLTEDELFLINSRYNLINNNQINQKPTTRISIMNKLPESMKTLISREAKAMKRLYEYLTAGFVSNTDMLIKDISLKAKSEEEKQIIIKALKGKSFEQIKDELLSYLTPIQYKIVTAYYNLDNFIPMVKNEPDIDDLAAKFNKTKTSVYQIKSDATKRLRALYCEGTPSNISYFIKMLCKKATNKATQVAIRNALTGISPEKLNELLDETIQPNHKKILMERYHLDQIVDAFDGPTSSAELAQKHNVAICAINNHERKALNKLIKYFEQQSEE